METTAQLLDDSLLLIWNDRNPEARLEAMNNVYTSDIAFYESNEGPAIKGQQAINELISRLQAQWPADFKFELLEKGATNNQVQQINWRLGVPGVAPAATGADVAIIEEGKIRALYLFLRTK